MSGLVIAIGLALAALILIWLVARLPIGQMAAPAAALLLGLAGYAWQGQPALGGHPVDATKAPTTFDERLVERRRSISDRLGVGNSWLIMSDGLARQGDSEAAVNVLVSGLRQYPKEAPLWVALGNALMVKGSGVMSPAADFAFREAERLTPPEAPAPRYFHGLAMAQSGRLDEARKLWFGLMKDLPERNPLRFELMRNLMVIDELEAQQNGRVGPAAPSAQPPGKGDGAKDAGSDTGRAPANAME